MPKAPAAASVLCVAGQWRELVGADVCELLTRDQLFTVIKTDHARSVVSIAYDSAQSDYYGHRLQSPGSD
jgi:hypothetical protein